MSQVTVVGGGVAGLTAAIAAAEQGAAVRLLEAHEELGGRARSMAGPYKANLGPHVIYKDGPFWSWLAERESLPRLHGPAAARAFAFAGRARSGARHRSARSPRSCACAGARRRLDRDFRSWVADHSDERTAAMLSAAAGVYTFHHDPGELSAAFVWKHSVRVLLSPPPTARYLRRRLGRSGRSAGGTGPAARRRDRDRARGRGAARAGPAIVATELSQAAELLGDAALRWPSGHTVCVDLGIEHRRGDPFIVSDLDEAGWVERFSAADPSLAPAGEELVQAQMPVRPAEGAEQTALRLERLLEAALPGSGANARRWRRRQVMDGRTGAARSARHELARPARGRARRRRLPRRRHGRRARPPFRGRLGQRRRGRPPCRDRGRRLQPRRPCGALPERASDIDHAQVWSMSDACCRRVVSGPWRRLRLGSCCYRRRGSSLELLLVHPGGPFWAKKDEGAWSIPKGELEEGEDPRALRAARAA